MIDIPWVLTIRCYVYNAISVDWTIPRELWLRRLLSLRAGAHLWNVPGLPQRGEQKTQKRLVAKW